MENVIIIEENNQEYIHFVFTEDGKETWRVLANTKYVKQLFETRGIYPFGLNEEGRNNFDEKHRVNEPPLFEV
jgi:hypothetical protein